MWVLCVYVHMQQPSAVATVASSVSKPLLQTVADGVKKSSVAGSRRINVPKRDFRAVSANTRPLPTVVQSGLITNMSSLAADTATTSRKVGTVDENCKVQ